MNRPSATRFSPRHICHLRPTDVEYLHEVSDDSSHQANVGHSLSVGWPGAAHPVHDQHVHRLVLQQRGHHPLSTGGGER